jgi:uncharacterized protein (DUF2237 family)
MTQRRRNRDTGSPDIDETTPKSSGASVGLSVMGRPLDPCSHRPKTGFFRDGCCKTDSSDVGPHVVCVRIDQRFLDFSKATGNDLSTPAPHAGFPGLKPGDCWCVCAERWKRALEAGSAPKVFLASTHERALDYVSLEELSAHALDLN